MPIKEWIIVPKHLEAHVTVTYDTDDDGNVWGSISPKQVGLTKTAKIAKNTRIYPNTTQELYVVGLMNDGTLIVGNDRNIGLTNFKDGQCWVTNNTGSFIIGTDDLNTTPTVQVFFTKWFQYEFLKNCNNSHNINKGNGYLQHHQAFRSNISFWYDKDDNRYDAKGCDDKGVVLKSKYVHVAPTLKDRDPITKGPYNYRYGFSMGEYTAADKETFYSVGSPFDVPYLSFLAPYLYRKQKNADTEDTNTVFSSRLPARRYEKNVDGNDKSFITINVGENGGYTEVVGVITSTSAPISGKRTYSPPTRETSENRIILAGSPQPRSLQSHPPNVSGTVLNPGTQPIFTTVDAQTFVNLPPNGQPVFDTWRIKIMPIYTSSASLLGIKPFCYLGTRYSAPSHYSSCPYVEAFKNDVVFIWDGSGVGGVYKKEISKEEYVSNFNSSERYFTQSQYIQGGRNTNSVLAVGEVFGLELADRTHDHKAFHIPTFVIDNFSLASSVSLMTTDPIPDTNFIAYGGSILGFSTTTQKLFYYGIGEASMQVHRLYTYVPHPSPTSTAWKSFKIFDGQPQEEGENEIVDGQPTHFLVSVEVPMNDYWYLGDIRHNSLTTLPILPDFPYQNLQGEKKAVVGAWRYQLYPYTVRHGVFEGIETDTYIGKALLASSKVKIDSFTTTGSTQFYFDGQDLNIKSNLFFEGAVSSSQTLFNFNKPDLANKNLKKTLTVYKYDEDDKLMVWSQNAGWQKPYWLGYIAAGAEFQIDYQVNFPDEWNLVYIRKAPTDRYTFVITHAYVYERHLIGNMMTYFHEVIELNNVNTVQRWYIDSTQTRERRILV